jgi:hypothetical protein
MVDMVAPNKDAVWDRVLSPTLTGLSAPAARAILGVRFGKSDLQRFNFLSTRAKRGTLRDSQRLELELYLDIGNLLTLMHSQARMALKRQRSRSRRKVA